MVAAPASSYRFAVDILGLLGYEPGTNEGSGWTSRMTRPNTDASPASISEPPSRPYGELRDDPRYGELKNLIENLPAEKLEKLKNYIKRRLAKR